MLGKSYPALKPSSRIVTETSRVFTRATYANISENHFTDGMRRPVSTGCDTLPIIDVLEAQEKGDRL
jgi:hypothetical protein